MQQSLRARVAGTTGGRAVHVVRHRAPKHRRCLSLGLANRNAPLEAPHASTLGDSGTCPASSSDSTSLVRPQLIQQQCSHNNSKAWVLPVVAAHQLFMSMHMHAHAAESVPPAAFMLFREFLDQIDALGPWGGILFIITVMCAEMIPLFPTQPLTLASGLLFGPLKGALFVVVGVTLAAINAYSLSKGVGRKLAERVIAHEVGEQQGPVQQQLAAVTRAIESGGFLQQVTAITLLRLTPVIPFSASNYLLGLTPIQLGPLILGTVSGMTVWSVLYASLGGASKVLLDGGADLDVLMEDLVDKAGKYSEDVAVCGLVLGVMALGYYLVTQRLQPSTGVQPDGGQQGLDMQNGHREEVLQNK